MMKAIQRMFDCVFLIQRMGSNSTENLLEPAFREERIRNCFSQLMEEISTRQRSTDKRLKEKLLRRWEEEKLHYTRINKELSNELFRVTRQGNARAVHDVLTKGADIHSKYLGNTCLHLALACGFTFVVTELLSCQWMAPVNATNWRGFTALHTAIYYKQPKAVILALLDRGADVNCRDDQGRTPLRLASENGSHDIIMALLHHRRIDVLGDENALHYAVRSGHHDFVLELLRRGADMHARHKNGSGVLHWACSHGQVSSVAEFIHRGADIHAETLSGDTPLHWACTSGCSDVVLELLAHGADVHSRNGRRTTPLHNACIASHDDVVQALLVHGADVHAEDNLGNTPLLLASMAGSTSIVDELRRHGANIGGRNPVNGDTPLIVASRRGHRMLVLDLLDRGADIHATNFQGVSPLAVLDEKAEKAEHEQYERDNFNAIADYLRFVLEHSE